MLATARYSPRPRSPAQRSARRTREPERSRSHGRAKRKRPRSPRAVDAPGARSAPRIPTRGARGRTWQRSAARSTRGASHEPRPLAIAPRRGFRSAARSRSAARPPHSVERSCARLAIASPSGRGRAFARVEPDAQLRRVPSRGCRCRAPWRLAKWHPSPSGNLRSGCVLHAPGPELPVRDAKLPFPVPFPWGARRSGGISRRQLRCSAVPFPYAGARRRVVGGGWRRRARADVAERRRRPRG